MSKLIITLFLLACTFHVQAQTMKVVEIPANVVKKPANDLVGPQGKVLDAGEAAAMAQKFLEKSAGGVDLGTLNPGASEDVSGFNPMEGKMWQDKKYSAEDNTNKFPDGEKGVKILKFEVERSYAFLARVQSVENPNLYYRVGISRFSRNALMRAALLRKLGYFVPSPKHYSKLRIYFASEKQKMEFLEEAQVTMSLDMFQFNLVAENDTKNHSLVLSDALLEVSTNDYFDLLWGMGPDPADSAKGLPAVKNLSRYRTYRAWLLSCVLMEIPESLNRYRTIVGTFSNGSVILQHPSATSFAATTWEDMQWILRRLAKLSEEDFREIVKLSKYHPELHELLYAKLVHRVKNFLEIFNLKSEFNLNVPSLDINSSSGLVKNGEVTQEIIAGSPYRHAHGDRESPFTSKDLRTYAEIRGWTAAIATGVSKLNEKLNLLKIETLAQEHVKDVTNDIINKINNRQPIYTKVDAWGGLVGGFNVGAARHVSTGTYYNSNAAIQLVDNISIGGSIGTFTGIDNLVTKANVFAGTNFMRMTDYTHVRPLTSIDEAKKVSWKDLVVPTKIRDIVKILEKNETTSNEDGSTRTALDEFLMNMRVGEVFTITKSIAKSAYAQINSSLDVLLGFTPLNFMNSISLGGDAARVNLYQISIMKTSDGKGQNLQVFVRSQKNKMFGLNVDVNYFIKLLSLRAETKEADLKTDAFVMDYDPNLATQIDFSVEDSMPKLQRIIDDYTYFRAHLSPTLMALLKHNDTSLLYQKFPHKQFKIDHMLKNKAFKSRLAWLRAEEFEEEHGVAITPPRPQEGKEGANQNPDDQKVFLMSYKKGQLQGRDWLGFGLDLLQGGINHKLKGKSFDNVDLAQPADPNPANIPFGKAYWRIINSEGDITPKGSKYPDMSIISHVWGGWSIKRQDFFDLIKEITGQFSQIPLASFKQQKQGPFQPLDLLVESDFQNVEKVDFYRINATLSVLPSGIPLIRDLIVQPAAKDNQPPKAQFLGRLYQKLSQKIGHKNAGNEMEMFTQILTIMGDGDFQAGKDKFDRLCQQEAQRRSNENGIYTGKWNNGFYYECLTPWIEKLMELSSNYPSDHPSQIKWMTKVLYILDEQIPLPQLLKYLQQPNYIFVVSINGFRTGDEDADLAYFSNTLGTPHKLSDLDYVNGLINFFATRIRVSPIELDRSLGGFR